MSSAPLPLININPAQAVQEANCTASIVSCIIALEDCGCVGTVAAFALKFFLAVALTATGVGFLLVLMGASEYGRQTEAKLIDTKNREVTDLSAEVVRLRAQVVTLTDERNGADGVATLRNRIADLEREIDGLELIRSQNQEFIGQIQQQKSAFEGTAQRLGAELSVAVARNSDLTAAAARTDDTIAQVQVELDRLRTENTQFRERSQALLAELEGLKKTIAEEPASLAARVVDLEDRLKGTETRLAQSDKASKAMMAASLKQAAEASAAGAASEQSSKRVAELESQVAALRGEIAAIRADLEASEETARSQDGLITELNSTLAEKNVTLQKSAAFIQEQAASIREKKAEIERLASRNIDLSKELEMRETVFDDSFADLEGDDSSAKPAGAGAGAATPSGPLTAAPVVQNGDDHHETF
ncbi:MAG: hypothetical protein HYX48_03295 [Chlamydiales bacterium]|nr:hypothetical protein [Chlamydiales bacterium]